MSAIRLESFCMKSPMIVVMTFCSDKFPAFMDIVCCGTGCSFVWFCGGVWIRVGNRWGKSVVELWVKYLELFLLFNWR